MLSSGGGYYEVIKAHCSLSRGEFRKPLPIKHILTVRADAFSPCVRSAMLYGWENWASNVSDLQLLQRICLSSTKLHELPERTPS